MIHSLAQFRPEEVFPFLLGAIFFMIPIVWILTAHQQRMAKIMRENQQGLAGMESDAVRRELDALRQLVSQQTIAIDNLASQQREIMAQIARPTLEERMTQS